MQSAVFNRLVYLTIGCMLQAVTTADSCTMVYNMHLNERLRTLKVESITFTVHVFCLIIMVCIRTGVKSGFTEAFPNLE